MDIIQPKPSTRLSLSVALQVVAILLFGGACWVTIDLFCSLPDVPRVTEQDAGLRPRARTLLALHIIVFAWLTARSLMRILALRRRLQDGGGDLDVWDRELRISHSTHHRFLYPLDEVAGASVDHIAMPFGIHRLVAITGTDGRQLARLVPSHYGMTADALRDRINTMLGVHKPPAAPAIGIDLICQMAWYSSLSVLSGLVFCLLSLMTIVLHEEVWYHALRYAS